VSVGTPEGANALTLPTAGRLIQNAIINYRRDHIAGLGLLERFQKIGAVTDVLTQERQMLNELTVKFGSTTQGSLIGSFKQPWSLDANGLETDLLKK
jgi:hypothetical protein